MSIKPSKIQNLKGGGTQKISNRISNRISTRRKLGPPRKKRPEGPAKRRQWQDFEIRDVQKWDTQKLIGNIKRCLGQQQGDEAEDMPEATGEEDKEQQQQLWEQPQQQQITQTLDMTLTYLADFVNVGDQVIPEKEVEKVFNYVRILTDHGLPEGDTEVKMEYVIETLKNHAAQSYLGMLEGAREAAAGTVMINPNKIAPGDKVNIVRFIHTVLDLPLFDGDGGPDDQRWKDILENDKDERWQQILESAYGLLKTRSDAAEKAAGAPGGGKRKKRKTRKRLGKKTRRRRNKGKTKKRHNRKKRTRRRKR
jgi:hypothetical protein